MDVTFDNRGTRLAGIFRQADGDGPHAAVAFVDGSGPAERDGWDAEAETLTGAGFASLAWDKPGCGASSGDWREQSFQDRAREALAAVACLQRQPGVDPGRVVLLGGSQGGWIGPLAASMSPEVAAVISLSGPGVSPYQQEAYRVEQVLRDGGADQAQVAEALTFFHHRAARLLRGDDLRAVLDDQLRHEDAPWYPVLGDDGVVQDLGFMARIYPYDPVPVLERVTCPVLAIWGERDIYVPVTASLERFRAALDRAGNPAYQLEVIPDADHGLRLPATGGAERGPRVPDLMERIITWLRRVLPPDGRTYGPAGAATGRSNAGGPPIA
ncbi:MAG TPA: alpha/beta fold hydrolase [Actinomycetota bacterium]|jgi:pimeloyl-ACP methyl ester carboxylesterase|nr:alpha/beta fold hydrolase [Actinomycetota bacterium]